EHQVLNLVPRFDEPVHPLEFIQTIGVQVASPVGQDVAGGTSRSSDAQGRRRSVFPNKSGEPMRESRLLERVLQPAAERAKLGRVTWHQFRDIHSSLLNDLRVPVKIAQGQLGHASIETTLNIYTHVVDASHRAAIEQLEKQLFQTVPKSQKAQRAG